VYAAVERVGEPQTWSHGALLGGGRPLALIVGQFVPQAWLFPALAQLGLRGCILICYF